jgi:hypothetical protein
MVMLLTQQHDFATDETYGVVCELAHGSLDNLHSAKPWLNTTRGALRPIGKSIDKPDYYQYVMTANDSLADVAGEMPLSSLTMP